MSEKTEFPPGSFGRLDETDDAHFYAIPRFVVHIDAATILALTEAYRELLASGGAVLDLMSSWVSHLPEEMEFSRVAGLGMNEMELANGAQAPIDQGGIRARDAIHHSRSLSRLDELNRFVVANPECVVVDDAAIGSGNDEVIPLLRDSDIATLDRGIDRPRRYQFGQ